MHASTTQRYVIPALIGAMCVAIGVVAGPLDPPSGAIAPTYKTLSEVEPRIAISAANTPGDANSIYRIAQSGSYYLTGNVEGALGKSTIEIAADNVTIDLHGFSLLGNQAGNDGITIDGPRRMLIIRNGIVRSHKSSGIFLGSSTGVLVEDVLSTENGLDGIWPGASATLHRVKALLNNRNGIDLSSTTSSHLVDCEASNNFLTGFTLGAGQILFERCIATANAGIGMDLSTGSVVMNCVAAKNQNTGFRTNSNRVTFDSCSAESNAGAGFAIGGQDHVIRSCHATSNGSGFTKYSGFQSVIGGTNHVYSDCTSHRNGKAGFEIAAVRTDLIRCVMNENTDDGVEASGTLVRVTDARADSNGQRGLDVGQGSVIERCLSRSNLADGLRVNGNGNATVRQSQFHSNTGVGLIVGNGSVIEECTVTSNTQYGCTVGALSVVRGSTFDANGTNAGITGQIHCTGHGNLIEDNYVYNGDPGIVVTFAGGTIVRRNIVNATSNNYGLIVGGNRVATINTSATLSSTNPNDNFSY